MDGRKIATGGVQLTRTPTETGPRGAVNDHHQFDLLLLLKNAPVDAIIGRELLAAVQREIDVRRLESRFYKHKKNVLIQLW